MSAFQIDRFKTQLKMAISRLVHLQKKLTAQSLAARKEIAELLRAGKTDQALAKVRYIVRDDFVVEAMELVQSFCDDLLKSAAVLAGGRECDELVREQARSVVYAADRLPVPELAKIREQLEGKFGRVVVPERETGVHPRLVLKLAMGNPDRTLCEQYLEAISASFSVDWRADDADVRVVDARVTDARVTDARVVDARVADARVVDARVADARVADARVADAHLSPARLSSSASSISDTAPPPYEELRSPPAPAVLATQQHLPMDYTRQQKMHAAAVPDFDELTRRFEALRSKKPQ